MVPLFNPAISGQEPYLSHIPDMKAWWPFSQNRSNCTVLGKGPPALGIEEKSPLPPHFIPCIPFERPYAGKPLFYAKK
jgi:hypothetical protein